MIPAFNRTKYLEKTLTSVLSQDPGPEEMQIEVVDDLSLIDDPEPLVRRVAGERVSFFRNPLNLGLMRNFNNCIERARGQWVHILHTDDFVLPGFYERLRAPLEVQSDIGAAFCRHAFADENGCRLAAPEPESARACILPDFVEKIGASQRIQFAAIVVRRSVYEQLGGFRTDLSSADWNMWIRVAANYPIWYEPEVLAAWRIHSGSKTTELMRSGGNVADARRCIEISHSVLPRGRADAISRNAREWLSVSALSNLEECIHKRDFAAGCNQLREGLRCGISRRWMKALWRMGLRMARGGLRRAYAAGKRQFARAPG
jgi:glycosyltransferase involved in cell wall biosynthesis